MQPDSAFYRMVFNISLKCSAHLTIQSLSSGIRATYVCLVAHVLLNRLFFTIEHRCAGIQRIISTVLSSIPFFLGIFLLHFPIFRIFSHYLLQCFPSNPWYTLYLLPSYDVIAMSAIF